MKLNSNVILLIIMTLVIAAGAYWFFFTGTGNEPPLTVTATTQNEAQTQFKLLVSELQPISFVTDIFTDPRFAALTDLTTPVAPESIGRLDPFAVLSGVSAK